MSQKTVLDNKSLDAIDIGDGIAYYGDSTGTSTSKTLFEDKEKTKPLFPKTTTDAITQIDGTTLPNFFHGTADPTSSLGKDFDLYYKYSIPSVSAGQTWNFTYTGKVQTFTAPDRGLYKLELAGARGGTRGASSGGQGGKTVMHVALEKSQTLYVVCGGIGGELAQLNNSGGYNGGGASGYNPGGQSAGGGGATHIATVTGTLASIGAANLSKILAVAGGGGGGVSAVSTAGGNGGGVSGANGTSNDSTFNSSTYLPTGGTQTSAGRGFEGSARAGGFGTGHTSTTDGWGGGGGGGLYGGGNGHGTTGAGGSGYIQSAKTSYNNVEYTNSTTVGGNNAAGSVKITLQTLAPVGGTYMKINGIWRLL